jgi:glutamate synthase (NADPH/NADH) large chain
VIDTQQGLYVPQTEHDSCGVGFVASIRGERSRFIVERGLEVLDRLAHRAATGADPETGDGAGILTQVPHRFFARVVPALRGDGDRRIHYAVGMFFLPPEPARRARCEAIIEEVIAEEGQRLLAWRDVPVASEHCGRAARATMPAVRQLFVERRRLVPSAFERKLFIIKKRVARRVLEDGCDPEGHLHVASFSAETLVYKGMLLPEQLPRFYPDLAESDFESAIALVHSRFSTNTLPRWSLAQPFTHVAHNGEINTVRGNHNWMQARRSQLASAKFGGPLERLEPILDPHGSDSMQFDQMLELLHLGGRTLPHAVLMMIPEAYEKNDAMADDRKAFYDYASSLMEPWDGPAAMAFTDGRIVGATLDRNGLRPARFVVTSDDVVVLASETGVFDVEPSKVVRKGRLEPGRIFVVDTEDRRIIDDDELKRDLVARWPYGRWLRRNVYRLENLPPGQPRARLEGATLRRQQRAFGYSDEDVEVILRPMAVDGEEPTGSMGTDTPLAVLSDRAPSLFSYFRQLFAQVTNPPIDPIREDLVMSLRTSIGMGGNTFDETPEQCHRITIGGPVLTNDELEKIRAVREGIFETTTLSLLYPLHDGPGALEAAVERLCAAAVAAVDDGRNILILSDRGVDADLAAIPSLLAVSAVHQHLVREGIRMQTGLIVECADAREVHHIALLIGFGAAAVNPWLALDTVCDLAATEEIPVSAHEAQKNVVKATYKGLLKVMSKMGISTVQSYRGAQIFEAVGIDPDLIARHFTGTPSRIRGVGLAELERENAERHGRAWGPSAELDGDILPIGGQYRWRRRGEFHRWNPATIATLQAAVKQNSWDRFEEFARLSDDETQQASTLRGLLDFHVAGVEPVPLEEVESAGQIVTRFVTGAMSFGSISAEAHEALAIAMNRLGGRSNTGEGGEESRRFTPDPDGSSRRSAIKQVASARFGVHTEYLVNADELQIKMAQGAKPGEGGQLPGHKVDERIARVRWSTPGVTLISPPPHHDIYSIEDLAQLIHDLQAVNAQARISVKLVSEVGVGTVAAGVAKAHAACVTIAGDSGGTGASPLSSVKHAGLPWELGVAETHQVLVQNELRARIRVQADGGLRTGRDVAIAALLGAEEFGFSTAPLVVLGCIMLRKCHLNTCSVGIATQDPELTKRFAGDPENVVRYFLFVAEQLRGIMARLGFRTLDEMVGRVDRLKLREGLDHWKLRRLDLSQMLATPAGPGGGPSRCVEGQPPFTYLALDEDLLASCDRTIATGGHITLRRDITNVDRSVGARLSGELVRRRGSAPMPDGAIDVRFSGSAGQSFGAFLVRGITFRLEGDANDYLGKGLSGGRICVFPPSGSRFVAEENVIVGNTLLYGATAGEVFIRGCAGERFAVRNSGARAVVEGVGDHGCEYMTGGVVVVLGRTGRNFAAGMSGGVAFVFDRDGDFRSRCNHGMVDLEPVVGEADAWALRALVEDHVRHTQSALGQRLLANWDMMQSRFVKVMPREYRRALQERAERRRQRAAAEAADAGAAE